ncbi:hypothetical protein K443DRAFT_412918 [Laccaria amethystina LaAM-08-1]|uniref:Uncharacterized protein n=1 Tax=Laccaria amethystina LaAM-08-1 TaxID=1095629 RepID=A0A0C9X638_9AGAR|nr:hypothetical protein K443DRAFT_412918 [Laccaria amethystina LaAM-08-1]
MGYWEDNYGDNVDFVNPDDANWQRDPQPPEGAPPIKRVERPESEWDTAKWGKSKYKVGSVVNKTGAKSQFLLTDKDLLPLYYKKAYNSMGYKTTKNYDKLKVERTAWEKYGGPTGLKAAKADKKNGVKPLVNPPLISGSRL